MINRGGAKTQRENEITESVIGAAIEAHKALGPGLLESAYEECLCHELSLRGLLSGVRLTCPCPTRALN